jgi:hypothetical protein
MKELMRKKYDIEQQQADAAKKQADAQAALMQAQADQLNAETRDAENSSGRQGNGTASYTVSRGDALAGSSAPTCKLASGASIRVTGGLEHSNGVNCKASQ